MNRICQELTGASPPGWLEIRESWKSAFPLLMRLADTPQDPIWHGEGNVDIHTEMVLDQVRHGLETAPGSTEEDRLVLQLAAIFHDIGKPLTTRTREIGGEERIASPHHASAGRNYLCLRLQALELPESVETAVLAITALHHQPRRLVQDDAPAAMWRQLARQCTPRWLYLLEQADLRGRICRDLDEQLEILELFRLRCEELGIWDQSDPWMEWKEEIRRAFPSRSEDFLAHAYQTAVMDAESGRIQSVEEAIARSYQLRDPAPELIVLWGPSGAGKSEWVNHHAAGHSIISLDALRDQIAGKRADQSMNGQVLQAAREQLKAHLNPRDHRNIIWDATNLRRDFRGPICQLGFDYGARVKIVCCKTPIPTLIARNKKRPHPVPESVLNRQLEVLEWPEIDEAHEIVAWQTAAR